MLSREAIAQVFELLPVSDVVLSAKYVTTYKITDEISVGYREGSLHIAKDWVYITVHGASVNLDAEDERAFLAWLKRNNGTMRKEALKITEENLDALHSYAVDEHHVLPKIEAWM